MREVKEGKGIWIKTTKKPASSSEWKKPNLSSKIDSGFMTICKM